MHVYRAEDLFKKSTFPDISHIHIGIEVHVFTCYVNSSTIMGLGWGPQYGVKQFHGNKN